VNPLLAIVLMILFFGGGWKYREWRAANPDGDLPDVDLSFKLTDATAEVKLNHTHVAMIPHKSVANIGPFLTGLAGASVAVVDYDDDGWPDIYFTSSGQGAKNQLYKNQHDGTFAEVGEQAGIADVNATTGSLRALFFDYDNDGHKDLVLSTTFCPRVFHNEGGGKFTEVKDAGGVDYCGYVYASNAVDYDGDGYLDLIIGGYYKPVDLLNPSTTKFMWWTFFSADNGGPVIVYHNEKGKGFKRAEGNLGITSPGWTHAVGIYDLRGTGKPDIYLATDFNTDRVYYSDGKGGYTKTSIWKYHGFGMNAEIADVDDDGHPVAYSTQVFAPGHNPGANDLWKFEPDGKVNDVAVSRGVHHCGWSWGAKWVDLDNDSHLELVVTNGMFSQSREKTWWYKMGVIEASDAHLREDATLWAPIKGESLSGYEKKCLYVGVGDGKFQNVARQTPLGSDETDGRGIAAIDYMNTGTMSLVEASVGKPPHFYKNQQLNKNHWIGFELVGTRGSRDAFGAKLVVELAGGRKLSRELEPANGFQSQSDHRLHVGLGADPKITSITVRWPRGFTQKLDGLALDQYHAVTEPTAD
jgi:enediyne biosynthesis protein E4